MNRKTLFANGFFAGLIIVIVLSFCTSCTSMVGSFSIDPSAKIHRTGKGEIIQFPDGTGVPDGYEYMTTAQFNTGALTVKCDYSFMVNEAKRVTIETGGDAFRLYNVKKPDYFTTTCYTGNILILKRKE